MSSQTTMTAEQAKQIIMDWKSDPELRAEFNNDFDVYAAYQRGLISGRISVCKGNMEQAVSDTVTG